ncbi:LysR family transcriptional regulator [Rhizosaccharibacter radicis]|uniref:LysR family transcriptional regulator n=1 Tax=Rhizosaccharibacter radicis TaxID=2782605 RepID=A0ABT1W0W2_9PROT|nr:LysR family transcriptional regulator [Acetobacteraceae bacterium KSS12]
MDLAALSDFNLVARHGGLGRASRASGIPKTTLSRRIAALEMFLGTPLIDRGPTAIRLTEAGEALHARTGPLLREIGEAGAAARDGATEPAGRLRISIPLLFAQAAAGQLAAMIVARHPAIRLDIVAEDRRADPVLDGFDLVIRVNPAPDEALVGRCILRDEMLLVAPAHTAVPAPDTPAGPVAAVVMGTVPEGGWRRREDGAIFTPKPIAQMSGIGLVRDAVRAGAGTAALPRSLVAANLREGRLRCWGHLDVPPVELWALRPARRFQTRKVQALLQAIDELFPGGAFSFHADQSEPR